MGYLQFDGVNDYLSVPDLNMAAGDTIEFKIIGYTGSGGSNVYLMDGITERPYLLVATDGKLSWPLDVMDIFLDGVKISSNSTDMPTDGLEHTIGVVFESAAIIQVFGTKISTPGSQTWNAGIASIEFTGTYDRFYSAAASGYTGSEFKDANSAAVMTLVNFPTDDSQWEGPATAGITTSDTLQPGSSFTLTATNFASAPVSPVTLTDSAGSTMTVAVTISGSGPYTAVGTMPTLAEAVTAGNSILFTPDGAAPDVTIELST